MAKNLFNFHQVVNPLHRGLHGLPGQVAAGIAMVALGHEVGPAMEVQIVKAATYRNNDAEIDRAKVQSIVYVPYGSIDSSK